MTLLIARDPDGQLVAERPEPPSDLAAIRRECADRVVRCATRLDAVDDLVAAQVAAVLGLTGRRIDLADAIDDVSQAQRRDWAWMARRLAGKEAPIATP